jgi:hypothetical protein
VLFRTWVVVLLGGGGEQNEAWWKKRWRDCGSFVSLKDVGLWTSQDKKRFKEGFRRVSFVSGCVDE